MHSARVLSYIRRRSCRWRRSAQAPRIYPKENLLFISALDGRIIDQLRIVWPDGTSGTDLSVDVELPLTIIITRGTKAMNRTATSGISALVTGVDAYDFFDHDNPWKRIPWSRRSRFPV
jgi:hypothetical protein